MLLVILSKGLCGGGCGNLGILNNFLTELYGDGREFLAECGFGDVFAFCHIGDSGGECPRDYLVIRLKTSETEPEDYDLSRVSEDDIKKHIPKVEVLLKKLRDIEKSEGRELIYAVFITKNPYLKHFSLGPAMTLQDIIMSYYSNSRCGNYFKNLTESDIVESEFPFFIK